MVYHEGDPLVKFLDKTEAEETLAELILKGWTLIWGQENGIRCPSPQSNIQPGLRAKRPITTGVNHDLSLLESTMTYQVILGIVALRLACQDFADDAEDVARIEAEYLNSAASYLARGGRSR
ncbi:MAG: hypothetical protein HC934_03030 [Acaryochloridaceae cyanobacterium SU_2_1]|nr:hypothetical protein [Acaryochloridaceae cyanobacterium SU_2_1]